MAAPIQSPYKVTKNAILLVPFRGIKILTNCKVTGFVPDRLKVLPYSLTEAPITKNMKLNLKVIESDAIDFEADRPEERLTEKFIEIMTKVISTDRSKLGSKT